MNLRAVGGGLRDWDNTDNGHTSSHCVLVVWCENVKFLCKCNYVMKSVTANGGDGDDENEHVDQQVEVLRIMNKSELRR